MWIPLLCLVLNQTWHFLDYSINRVEQYDILLPDSRFVLSQSWRGERERAISFKFASLLLEITVIFIQLEILIKIKSSDNETLQILQNYDIIDRAFTLIGYREWNVKFKTITKCANSACMLP